MQRKHILLILVICVMGYAGIKAIRHQLVVASRGEPWRQQAKKDESLLATAYQQQQSNLTATVSGRVIQVLPETKERAGEQRFIIEIGNGMTLQVVHDVTKAGWIAGIEYGSQATVSGNYVWSLQGGELHDAFPDSAAQKSGGWIEYAGRRYE
jgi:hypothetical protein